MPAFEDGRAAHLLHLDAAPRGAELHRQALERDDAVADAVQLQIGRAAGEVVEQQHRAVLAGEVLLESEDLAPVAQRVLGEKPHLGQAIEDDALRLHRLHLVEDRLHGLAKLDLPGMEQRLLLVERQGPLGRGELEQVDAVERPVMARRDGAQLLLGSRRA